MDMVARIPYFHDYTVTQFRQRVYNKLCGANMDSTDRREKRYNNRRAARDNQRASVLEAVGSFEDVFSFENLYAAYRASIKGVGWKASTQRFCASNLVNIHKIREQLLSGKYRSKGFYEFDIFERGKARHIKSVHISERIVQRCLCDNALIPALSRSFIYDNGASLRGKGYDFSVNRISKFLSAHYRKHGSEGYALLFDFSKYFDNAQHKPIFTLLDKSGLDNRLLELSKHFISNFGLEGLGLGSQISQIMALALPSPIDHYIKDVLRMKHYARYMDDGIIISESKESLQMCLSELQRLCHEYSIRLNLKKTQIVKLSRGFTFLKVRFRFGENGAIIKKPYYRSITKMRSKLKTFYRWVECGKMNLQDVKASLASWLGYMRRFNAHYVISSIVALTHRANE